MFTDRPTARLALLACTLTLAGCDQLTGAADAEKLVAEGKATGSACRHSGRAIEDCYAINQGAPRSAIFAGWKEMNDYMRENKIDDAKPELPPVRMKIPNEEPAPAPKAVEKEKTPSKPKPNPT